MAIRGSLERLLRRSPMQLAFRRRAAQRLAVLAYHGIDDPGTFRDHLDYLTGAMRPVSLEQVVEALSGERELPPHAVLLTFDDGHRSLLEAGLPLLRERDCPAVAFVVAGVLDSDEPFWWTEVEQLVARGGSAGGHQGLSGKALVARLKNLPDRERLQVLAELRRTAGGPRPRTPQLRSQELRVLEAAGVAVGNHTLTHPCLPHCDGGKVAAEVGEADRALRDVLGHHPRAFAYPNGDWDQRAERLLAAAGYQAAFLFDHRVNRPGSTAPLRISRVRANAGSRLDRLALIASGLHPALHRARGRS